jgi:hypothetical protein
LQLPRLTAASRQKPREGPCQYLFAGGERHNADERGAIKWLYLVGYSRVESRKPSAFKPVAHQSR